MSCFRVTAQSQNPEVAGVNSAVRGAALFPSCNKENQCKGFTADFCVYVDGNAPPGGTYETQLTMIIVSAYPNGTGQKLLARFQVPFSWYIK